MRLLCYIHSKYIIAEALNDNALHESTNFYAPSSCKVWLVRIGDLKNLRHYLKHDASFTVANALAGSPLDYYKFDCNSLFGCLFF